jgi:hypothetical protein
MDGEGVRETPMGWGLGDKSGAILTVFGRPLSYMMRRNPLLLDSFRPGDDDGGQKWTPKSTSAWFRFEIEANSDTVWRV